MYLTEEDLGARVGELGAEISRDYRERDLVLVTIMKGAFVFAADLAQAITVPHSMDFVSLAGYGSPLGGHSGVRILKDVETSVRGRNLLLVQNVIDTGMTLNYLVKVLRLRGPSDLGICSLLDRPYRRLVDDLPIRYVGFTVPDQFFAGYGFDLAERYRGLRALHVIPPPAA